MQWTGLNELREKYLSFFESKGHLRLDSFPLVPKNDPSLLLINSGMAPMKKWFLAQEEPPRHRVTTCQKCIRTPDIERVGITARHGTFFEMLGNFSFQDYFKDEVIPWAWEFLTSDEWMAIPQDRLHISVYEEDDEAYEIWTKKVGIAPDHMVRLGKEDNFWEHGSGPCGPCSEIYFDRGPEYGCGKPTCGVGCDCDRYMEIWNLVFSQFDADGKGHYERLACVMQGVGNLFEVDTVQSVLHHVEHIANKTYGEDDKTDISIRVITDHIRSTTFMASDGILPSNEGRGYVMRRLLRRAARHGRMLGINRPFLTELVDTVIETSKAGYPELEEHADYIKKVIGTEEERFYRTIDQGMNILNGLIDNIERAAQNGRVRILSGLEAFKLNDTFGFPLDLTKEIAAEAGIKVDEETFRAEMQKQKSRARAERLAKDISGWSEDLFGELTAEPTKFTGYTTLEDTGVIQALSDEEELLDAISTDDGPKDGVLVILDKTPFYAEMGGQVADHGVITMGESVFQVNNVQKDKGGKYLHHGKMLSGSLKVEDEVTASIDMERRKGIMRAHSATHLLQKALTTVLGDHVHQAGSLVEPDYLRFDFTHYSALTQEEMAKVNAIVQDSILEGYPIDTREMPIEEARKLGATALFSEKYGQTVRVVNMSGYSIEFCGGTHLDNTAKVGAFQLTSEGSVASGVRRIEAVTGKACMARMEAAQAELSEASAKLKVKPADLAAKIQASLDEVKELKRQIEQFQAKEASAEVERLLQSAKEIGGVKVLTAKVACADAGKLRQLGDMLRDKAENIVGVLASVNGEKPSFLAICGKSAVAKGMKAGELVKLVCCTCGGSGGGKPDSAMGGGKDAAKVDEALAQVEDFAKNKM